VASEQLRTIVNLMRARVTAERASPEELRAGMNAMTSIFPVASDVSFELTDAGGVPAAWVSASRAAGDRVVLYLHGGGYVVGSVHTHRDLCGRISRAAGVRVLSVDYRLGPEDPFPAAVEDAVAAYSYLLSQGVSPERVVIAGDSAGGGLTLATLLALRDSGRPLPAGGVCLSPWTDLAMTGDSMTTRAEEDPMVQREPLEQMAAWYLGGADPTTPLASPLYADPAGLPPLYVQVGTAETLLDDARRLASRAQAAGVSCELEEWPDMIHVFQAFAQVLPEGQQAVDKIGEWIGKRVARPEI
jgi:acetyl esterase/lipase